MTKREEAIKAAFAYTGATENDVVKSQATQDQVNAKIRDFWTAMNPECKQAFSCWVIDKDVAKAKTIFMLLNDEWIQLIQYCALAGLRGAVLGGLESEATR